MSFRETGNRTRNPYLQSIIFAYYEYYFPLVKRMKNTWNYSKNIKKTTIVFIYM